MNGTGRSLNGCQPLILPSISMRRSNDDTWILVYGFSEANNSEIGKRLQAPSFGCTVFRAAVRVSRLPYLLNPLVSASVEWCSFYGLGKTVLSSTVLEHILQEEANSNAAYFYFDFNDSTKQYHDKMLRSLVVQLSFSHQSIPDPLLSLFKSCQSGAKPPQTKDLETLLKALIDLHEKTFIVLDALDECEDRQELLNFIENIIGWKSQKLNVAVTSRKLKELEDFFDAEIEEKSRLSIQNEKVDEDIRSYVHGKLQNDRRFKRWRGQPNVQEEIATGLMKKSDGM